MALPRQGSKFSLSDAAMDKLRQQEDLLVTSIIQDMASPDPKISTAARKQLIDLGFTAKDDGAKGVVSFLLEKARQGAFGSQAATFGADGKTITKKLMFEEADKESASDFLPGEGVVDDAPPPPAPSHKSALPNIPLAAMGSLKGGA